MTESTKIVGGLVNMRLKILLKCNYFARGVLGWIYDNLLHFCTYCIDRRDFVNHRESINAHHLPQRNPSTCKEKNLKERGLQILITDF